MKVQPGQSHAGIVAEMRAAMADDQLAEYRAGMMLGLIHVFAVPRYSAMLVSSSEYQRDPVARSRATVDLLTTLLESGPDSPAGRTALRRTNEAHRRAGLTTDDLRYALAIFVVVPRWWAAEVTGRAWSDDKTAAVVRFYGRVGELMSVHDLPDSYERLAELVDSYEAAKMRYSAANEQLVTTALAQLTRRLPSIVRRAAPSALAALLDDRVRLALGLPRTSALGKLATQQALRLHARLGEMRRTVVRGGSRGR